MTAADVSADGPAARVPASVWRWARIAALVALIAIIGIALRKIDWPKTVAALSHAHFGWIAIALFANAAILPWWALFWKALRPPTEISVTFGRMFEITSISSALMNTLPFGGGHASAIVLLVKRAGTTQRGALTILALDQLGEGIVKVLILAAASLVIPLPTWMRAALTTLLSVVGVWLVALALVSRLTKELAILRSFSRSTAALACVAAMKIAELVAIMAVQAAYGADVSVAGSLLVLATVILATMLPISPGNLGAYEGSVFLVYRYLGVAPELALSLALIQHLCFLIPAIGIGFGFSASGLKGKSPARFTVTS